MAMSARGHGIPITTNHLHVRARAWFITSLLEIKQSKRANDDSRENSPYAVSMRAKR
jgi:hypothetical protein